MKLTKLCILYSLSACSSLPLGWNQEEVFVPQDGQYFPKFVHEFFPNSLSFQRRYPTIPQARMGIRMIQVKQLAPEDKNHNESNLSWSRNGRYLSYEQVDFRTRSIFIRELNGKHSQSLNVEKTRPSNFLDGLLSSHIHSYNSGLSWSSSEQQYAFMSNGGIGEYNIYVGNVDEDPEVAAQSPSKDGYAQWSPKGSELAFVSARSGRGDIYTLNLDNSTLQAISQSPEPDLFPEWLPNGQEIIYTSGSSNRHQILKVSRNSNGQWQRPIALTQWSNDNLRPKVSPDGNWVAFYGSSQDKHWNIYVIPTSNQTALDLDRSKYLVAEDILVDLNTGPAWSPDGTHLFFVKKDSQKFNPIHAYNLRNGGSYFINTKTKMNRDLLISKLGVLSFRAQVGAWDKVYVALTNLGSQIQGQRPLQRIVGKNKKYVYHPRTYSKERVTF